MSAGGKGSCEHVEIFGDKIMQMALFIVSHH